MKRTLILMLALILILGNCSACTGNSPAQPSTPDQPQYTEPEETSEPATDPEPISEPTSEPVSEPTTEPTSESGTTSESEPTKEPIDDTYEQIIVDMTHEELLALFPDENRDLWNNQFPACSSDICDATGMLYAVNLSLERDGTEKEQLKQLIMHSPVYADAVARALLKVTLLDESNFGDKNPWLVEAVEETNKAFEAKGWTSTPWLCWNSDKTVIIVSEEYFDFAAKLAVLIDRLDVLSGEEFTDCNSVRFATREGSGSNPSYSRLNFQQSYVIDKKRNSMLYSLGFTSGEWTQPIIFFCTGDMAPGYGLGSVRWFQSAFGSREVMIDSPNQEGYMLRYTVRFSQWIKTDDTELLNSQWKIYGNKNEIPPATYSEWGLKLLYGGKYGPGYDGKYHSGVLQIGSQADFYYMFGTVKIENITKGDWHFTESHPCGPFLRAYVDADYPAMMGRTYYGNTTRTYDNEMIVEAGMKTDRWGPVSFVLVDFSTKDPAHPDGINLDHLTVPLTILVTGDRDSFSVKIPVMAP